MSYKDRLRTCTFISNSGKEFTLQFDDVGRDGSRKAAIHELPQQNQPDIQDLGLNGERLSLEVYLTGQNYDQAADLLWEGLKEPGPGQLNHPRYGNIPVMTLSWGSKESFVNGAGRANFTIEFIRYADNVAFPITSTQISESVTASALNATASAKLSFIDKFAPINASDVMACKNQVLAAVNSASASFNQLASGIDSVTSQIKSQVSSIESNIDALISAPGDLFDSIQGLYDTVVGLPGRIKDKVTSYAGEVNSLLTKLGITPPPTASQAALSVATSGMITMSSAKASTIGTTLSRQEATTNADTITAIRTANQSIIELSESAVPGFTLDATTAQAIESAIVQASDSILQGSFDLLNERRFIVPSSTPLITLLWKFYGDVTDQLIDDFIDQNHLIGDEILMVPTDREVVYYA